MEKTAAVELRQGALVPLTAICLGECCPGRSPPGGACPGTAGGSTGTCLGAPGPPRPLREVAGGGRRGRQRDETPPHRSGSARPPLAPGFLTRRGGWGWATRPRVPRGARRWRGREEISASPLFLKPYNAVGRKFDHHGGLRRTLRSAGAPCRQRLPGQL